MSEYVPEYEELDDAEIAAYIAWIEEQAVDAEPDTLPKQFELDSEAQALKAQASDILFGLTTKLESEDVRRRGYLQQGGEHEVIKEMQEYQAVTLPEIFKNVRFESDSLFTHTTQETPVSCQPTCIQNALHCFGVEVTQAEIAQACRFDHYAAPPFPGQMIDYVREKGFTVEIQKTVFDMINSLTQGAKVVIDLGQPTFPVEHAILATGIRIENGSIDFLINDPQTSAVQTLSLEKMLAYICPTQYRVLSPTYSISRNNTK